MGKESAYIPENTKCAYLAKSLFFVLFTTVKWNWLNNICWIWYCLVLITGIKIKKKCTFFIFLSFKTTKSHKIKLKLVREHFIFYKHQLSNFLFIVFFFWQSFLISEHFFLTNALKKQFENLLLIDSIFSK